MHENNLTAAVYGSSNSTSFPPWPEDGQAIHTPSVAKFLDQILAVKKCSFSNFSFQLVTIYLQPVPSVKLALFPDLIWCVYLWDIHLLSLAALSGESSGRWLT